MGTSDRLCISAWHVRYEENEARKITLSKISSMSAADGRTGCPV